MASINTKIQLRLTWFGRLTLKVATQACRCGFKLPHSLVKAITNRSWLMRIGDGEWRSIRINDQGQVLA
jgi:hypothetical protein